jgi:hypothetical protein
MVFRVRLKFLSTAHRVYNNLYGSKDFTLLHEISNYIMRMCNTTCRKGPLLLLKLILQVQYSSSHIHLLSMLDHKALEILFTDRNVLPLSPLVNKKKKNPLPNTTSRTSF